MQLKRTPTTPALPPYGSPVHVVGSVNSKSLRSSTERHPQTTSLTEPATANNLTPGMRLVSDLQMFQDLRLRCRLGALRFNLRRVTTREGEKR